MKSKKTIDANYASSLTSYIFTEVAGIYPITPSSPMAEHIDEWSNNGKLNAFNDRVKVIEMQSEAGAAGLVHGALQAGTLASTYTASQGLLLMIPNMYKISGEMLPLVMHVAARSLSTHALSIMGDHQDVYAARQTGFAMLASSSVQDASYLSAVAHLSAIKGSIPFMHFFDGFRTSHELQKIDVLDDADLINLIDKDALNKFRKRALNPINPVTRGTAQNDDIYFQATEVRNKFYDELPSIVFEYMNKINALAGTNYAPFNYYGASDATKVIVAMGSVCETIKETIDNLKEEKLGLIEVHLYRPFAKEYLLKILPATTEFIAVLDRTKEPGSNGEPLYLDIANIIPKDIKVVGGRYGLSSKNTTPAQIKAVYDNLNDNAKTNFTIGITDDVTNLSLEVDESFKTTDSEEFLIYGYGSDGMVSAAKSIIKLVGDSTSKYVQGYFQYDSKKSGSVTISQLRFNDHEIRSTYYVDSPKLIVCTKDSYLSKFDLLDNIKEDGIFILNTNKNKDEVINLLSDEQKYLLNKRRIKFYIIDGYKLAEEAGIKNKVSTIIETVIVYLTNIVDFELAKTKLKELAHSNFYKKGMDIVNANYMTIDNAINYLEEIKVDMPHFLEEKEDNLKDMIDTINKRKGDQLPTSAFLDKPDGTFEAGNTKYEKRAISEKVPTYLKDNCIQCNLCSVVCPHGVIRPFLLDEEEYQKAPDVVKNKCTKPIEPNLKDYYYAIGVSILDCTGCGICVKVCPGKKGVKALEFRNTIDEYINKEHEVSDYLFNHVKEKNIEMPSLKGTQFKTPKFEFSGACAGCGETPYIKLLTQLFGNRMIIANATGCSSIYGASAPSMPYSVPWASSLFEDNAEYGYGILMGNDFIRNRIKKIMSENLDNVNKELFTKWLGDSENYNITKEVYDNLDYSNIPSELLDLKDYIPSRSIWTIGGDGWAYDIGFGGIDHVLASNENVNMLILDTQVYSNTGGQASKATPKGGIAAFASDGKKTNTKDIAKMLMAYPNVYVAQVNLGANPNQMLKAFKEAAEHNGPSIIIAYSPCIAHGISGGLENSYEHEKLATKSGFFPIFRYKPSEEKFYLDSKEVDFNLYEEFLNSQTRFKMLQTVNQEKANYLLDANKQSAIKRFEYYKSLDKENI
jgi:pyruvate-ferredoxin/flavodoxin oxidoreductase